MIRKVLAYDTAGQKVAEWPENGFPKIIVPFFTAMRSFFDGNGFNEIEKIILMKEKCLFLHNTPNNISFAVIGDRDEDDNIMMSFLANVRDHFVKSIPCGLDFNDVIDVTSYNELLHDAIKISSKLVLSEDGMEITIKSLAITRRS
jgi:hypothetical protein